MDMYIVEWRDKDGELVGKSKPVTKSKGLKWVNGASRQNPEWTYSLNAVEVVNITSNTSDYKIYGRHLIDLNAIKQMDLANSLHITAKSALMPDAHVGYGLPIGGVWGTKSNHVVPYAVGFDIACRMRLSIVERLTDQFTSESRELRKYLVNNTRFGKGASFQSPNNHKVMESDIWNQLNILKGLKDTALSQLGSSGSGNHFVEWGIVEISNEINALRLPTGKFLGLLSHSGSRGLGHKIATYYSDLAVKQHPELTGTLKNLAWLDMDTQAGQDYWLAMELCGEYAAANHEVIHNNIIEGVDKDVITHVENHHNFAWKETHFGQDMIVHRKGATPAGKGVLGIIPGSMGTSGVIVSGKGNEHSLNSASHGAGRVLGRTQAKSKLNKEEWEAYMKYMDITVIGGDLDESPDAYKNIHHVMAEQTDLVNIEGYFQPKIVRMAGD